MSYVIIMSEIEFTFLASLTACSALDTSSSFVAFNSYRIKANYAPHFNTAGCYTCMLWTLLIAMRRSIMTEHRTVSSKFTY